MNIRVPLLLGCLFALSSQAQESKRALWTWTDANGVTHFSDRPVPGARKVEIATSIPPPPQVATPQPSELDRGWPHGSSGIRLPIARDLAARAGRSRSSAPTRRSTCGSDRSPSLRRDTPGASTSTGLDRGGRRTLEAYTLTSLSRGAHSLSAVVYDERGNELIRSQPRVFHVRQPTINAPAAVGPNLRPPVTPTPTVPGNRAPRGG